MKKVEIVEVKSLLDLLCHYQNQQDAQPCYIELDLEEGTLAADYNAEIGGGVPENVWNNRALRCSIPLMTSTSVNWLAEDAWMEIDEICAKAERDITLCQADDWFDGCPDGDLGIDADTTDSELEEVAETLENEAFDEGVVVEDVVQYLRKVRERLREREDEEEDDEDEENEE